MEAPFGVHIDRICRLTTGMRPVLANLQSMRETYVRLKTSYFPASSSKYDLAGLISVSLRLQLTGQHPQRRKLVKSEAVTRNRPSCGECRPIPIGDVS